MEQKINLKITTGKKRYNGMLLINKIEIYNDKTLITKLDLKDISKIFGELEIVLAIKEGDNKFYDLLSKKEVTNEFWKVIEKIVIGINKIKMKG